MQAAPSVKVLKPSSADAYHQLNAITIQVQASTGPADVSGDRFDHYGPVSIGRPDKRSLDCCGSHAKNLAALTKKLFP